MGTIVKNANALFDPNKTDDFDSTSFSQPAFSSQSDFGSFHAFDVGVAPASTTMFESAGGSAAKSAAAAVKAASKTPAAAPTVYQITDAGIASDISKYEINGSLDYKGLLKILEDAAVGGMTGTEFTSLEGLAQRLNGSGATAIHTTSYLQYIADAVITGNAANATWTGGKTAQALGNLTATSTSVQMNELIDKWFLGTDLPYDNGVTYVDKSSTLPLYGATGSPVISDVNQGSLGDCYFMASIAEIAKLEPAAIKNMITDNGDNTYGVRFFEGGKAVYVTVDGELPVGGTRANGSNLLYANGSDLWPALVEKAYAELTLREDGQDSANSYAGIAGGWADPLTEITGKSYNTYVNPHTASAFDSTAKTLAAALASGEEAIYGSISSVSGLVSSHMYSVTGVDTAHDVVTLRNPWGDRSGANPYVNISLSTLSHDSGYFFVATGATHA